MPEIFWDNRDRYITLSEFLLHTYVFVFCEKHYWINVILRNSLSAKIYSPHRHVHCNKICKTAFYKSPNYPLKIKYHLLKTKYNQNIKYSPHLKKPSQNWRHQIVTYWFSCSLSLCIAMVVLVFRNNKQPSSLPSLCPERPTLNKCTAHVCV